MASAGRAQSPIPGQMVTLDDLDHRIVAALRGDGRLSMRALAARLHISRANVYARVERLEKTGVITGYSATIDPRKYGHGLSAYVFVKIAQQSWQRVGRQVLSIPAVDHAALVSGEHDIMLLVRTRDAAELRDLVLTQLQAMPEVDATQTVLIFDELFPRDQPGDDAGEP
jgi:DNA-binding Lrp family transcriptional regulator